MVLNVFWIKESPLCLYLQYQSNSLCVFVSQCHSESLQTSLQINLICFLLQILDDEVSADFYVAVPDILPKLVPLKNKLRKKFPKSKRGTLRMFNSCFISACSFSNNFSLSVFCCCPAAVYVCLFDYCSFSSCRFWQWHLLHFSDKHKLVSICSRANRTPVLINSVPSLPLTLSVDTQDQSASTFPRCWSCLKRVTSTWWRATATLGRR